MALRANMHFVLVHETRVDRHGAPFKAIIDATPNELVWDQGKGSKRLYASLAALLMRPSRTHGCLDGLHSVRRACGAAMLHLESARDAPLPTHFPTLAASSAGTRSSP